MGGELLRTAAGFGAGAVFGAAAVLWSTSGPMVDPGDGEPPPGESSVSTPLRRAREHVEPGSSTDPRINRPAELNHPISTEERADRLAELLRGEAQFDARVPDDHHPEARRALLDDIEIWLADNDHQGAVRPLGIDCSQFPCIVALLEKGSEMPGGGYAGQNEVQWALWEALGERAGTRVLNHGLGLSSRDFLSLHAWLPDSTGDDDPVRSRLLELSVKDRADRATEALYASAADTPEALAALLRHIEFDSPD